MLEPDSAFHQLKSKLNFLSLFSKNQVDCSLCSFSLPSGRVLKLGCGHCSLLEMDVKSRVFLRKWSDISETVDISALAPAVIPTTLQGGLAVLWPLGSLAFRTHKCAETKAAGTTVLFYQTCSNLLWDPSHWHVAEQGVRCLDDW